MKSWTKISSGAIRVSLLFFLLSALWITLSDQAVDSLTSDAEIAARLQTYKGWAYVLVASMVVCRLLQREILWRRKAEEALERSEMQSWELVQRVGDVIFSLTPDTIIRSLNPAFTTLTGWACADWLGKPFAAIVYPADLPLAMEKFAAVLRGESVLALELRIQCKDRGAVLFELTIAPHLRDGIVAQALGVGRDISERRRGDERLRQLSRAVEQSPALVLITDTDGRIEYVSPIFSEVTGYALEEVKGRNPRILKSSRGSPDTYKALWTTIRAGGVWRGQFYNRKKNGESYWVSASISGVTNDTGVITHFVAVQEDITERKKAEEALRASEQRFEAFMNHSPALAFMKDEAGQYVYTNVQWQRHFQKDQGEVLGKTSREVLAGASADDLESNDRLVLSTGRSVEFTECVPTNDGVSRTWRVFKFPFCDASGRRLLGGVALDITERVQAEEVLHQLMEQELFGVYVVDEQKKLRFVNQRFADLGGYTREEILSQESVLDLVAEEDRALLEARIRQRLVGTPLRNDLAFRFRHKSGTLVYAEAHGTRINYRGRPAVLGVIMDITERKKAEEELRASQEFATNIIESSLDMILTTDLERRITRANHAALIAFGYEEAELVGQKATLLYDNSVESNVVDRSLLETGRFVGEVINRRKSGELFPSLLSASVLRDGHGQIVGHMGISRDITERKRAENKMREQAALLDITSDAILVRDLEQRVLYWNKGAERLYGWRDEEVLGRKITEFLWEEQALPQIESIEPTVREAGHWWGEMHHVARNGRKLIVEGRLTLMYDSDATPRSVLMVSTDVTEKRQLQKQFLHVQRLESIGTLAGGIAHDLNNILAPVLMSVDILRTQVSTPAAHRILNTVQAAAQRGADIVRQVLTFARGIDGERNPVDLRHLVDELVRMADETFPKSILLHSRVPSDIWPVTGDATQLHQILLNLCVNARDAMTLGGTLTVTAENAQLDEQYASMNPGAKPGPYVILKVSDTGTGISPEIIDRIFDPFFTTKAKGKGTGLGLSTTLGIVKAHGGFLQVESQLSQGSTFRIFLPATPNADAHTDQRPFPAAPPGHGEWILVVDDELAIRETTQVTLERAGYRVVTADDGVDGLAIYARRQSEISVVLSDLMMPVMDGIAMIRALKKMNPKVRVIASSGLAWNDKRADLEAMGIDAFLTKPFVAEKLLFVLSEVMNRADDQPPGKSEAGGGSTQSPATSP